MHFWNMHSIHLENSLAYVPQSNGAAESSSKNSGLELVLYFLQVISQTKFGAKPRIFLIGCEIDYPPNELRIRSRSYYRMLIEELISVEYSNLERKVSNMCTEVILHLIRNSYLGLF